MLHLHWALYAAAVHVPACLCVSLKEKMWLEVHEFQSASYIAIVCVEIYIV